MRHVQALSAAIVLAALGTAPLSARAQDATPSSPEVTSPSVGSADQSVHHALAEEPTTGWPSPKNDSSAPNSQGSDDNDPGADAPASDSVKPASDADQSNSANSAPAEKTDEPAAADVKPEAMPETKTADAPAVVEPVFALPEVRDLLPAVRDGAQASEEALAVSATYAARRDDAIWVTPKGLTPKAVAVIEEIQKAGDYGLDASDYVLPSIPKAADSSSDVPRGDLADAELKLSLAALNYARDARGGRITQPSKQLSSYLDREPRLIEPRLMLEELTQADDPSELLRKLHPQNAQFEKLRKRYVELKSQQASAKEIVRLPAKGPKLVPGMKHRDVGYLRERLNVPVAKTEGTEADDQVYDPALVDAVKAFQEKNGQKPDGIVGKTTRASLNDIQVPDPDRILANMEQWRWMPEDLGETYIHVNIPEFMVRVIHQGKVVLEERVVTGQTNKQTPVFSDQLEAIIFHPRWNVPESIKVLELYPSLARGGGSFQRQGLKLMRNGREISPGSVDWGSADIRNFDVYQPSGPSNALGLVKFIFPNKHGVYLHDTPAKSLFNEASRPFSHGCMRVQNPLELAKTILALDKEWEPERVDEVLEREPDEVPVQIEKKIPVHVTYFTDVIDDNGEERIFKDVYGHEQRIKLALAGKFDQIAIGPDHLAPVEFKRIRVAQSPEDFGSFFGYSDSPPGKPQKGAKYKNNNALGDFFKNVFGGF